MNVRALLPVRRPHPALVFTLALAGIAGACRSTPAAPQPASADTWAVVDGREITRDEVEKAYRRTAPVTPTVSDEEALTAKLNILNELIVQDLLLAKARELKIELTDAELDSAYAEGRKDIPDPTSSTRTARSSTAPRRPTASPRSW